MLAALHLVAMCAGVAALWVRGRELRTAASRPEAMRRAAGAHAVWVVALAVGIATGLVRMTGLHEKGAAYYEQNALFLLKMTTLALLLAADAWPTMVLLSRIVGRRGPSAVAPRQARWMARVSVAQVGLFVLVVLAASGMARGLGG